MCWQSKTQPSVALSTCEAEYQAAGGVARDAVWLRSKLLPELGVDHPEPAPIRGDNQVALCRLRNPMTTARSKRIDIIHHWAKERVAEGVISFKYIASADNTADCLTKALPRPALQRCMAGMGMSRV